MITKGEQTIGWDVENRVITVTGGVSFIYDGDGNRVKKTENNETTLYVNQYYEKNITTGIVTTYYYLGGKLVAQREDTTVNYMHLDHLGSTSVISDSSGTQTETIRYFPFGATRSGSVTTERKFTGQTLDDTGLYYYGARYYDATIGRFISADTIISDPFNPQTLNRYSYCLNNPLKYIDPTGHDVELTEAEVMLLIEQEIERQEREERAESNSGSNGEPEMPLEDDDTEYTVVWGYADVIPVFPVLFSYYHSVLVVQNQNGDYFRVETWGGGVALGGEILSEIWQVGETVKIEDGKWVGSGGIRMPFIDLEPHFQIQTDTPYVQGGFNKHFYSGLGITIGVQITRQSVTQISRTETYNNIPRWVINAYRRLGYDFAK